MSPDVVRCRHDMSDESPLSDPRSFEALLGEISSRLLATLPEALDAEIQNTVEQLVVFFAADRGSLMQSDGDGTVRITHTFVKDGV